MQPAYSGYYSDSDFSENTPRANFRRLQGQQIAQQGEYGTDATDAYVRRAKGFDAQAGLSRYAKGAWGSISDALGRTLRDLGGSATGAGRFDSGFFDEDRGQVVHDALGEFSNRVAQQSVNAQGQQLESDQELGRFGERANDNALDLVSSRREEEENADREIQARKRKRRGGIAHGIGEALGTAAGAFFGGPAGAAVGGQIGGGIGDIFGG